MANSASSENSASSDNSASSEEAWTVLRLLAWTTDYLKKHGAESARLDAEVLLANALGCGRVDLYMRFDQIPNEAERALFREHISQRAMGKPVAYLVGRKEFYSLEFEVTESVLIPRPETEFLLVGLFDWVKTLPGGVAGEWTLCDVGTGSGILAITSAIHLKNSHVWALDISTAALEVARRNAQRYQENLGNRVTFWESDLFSGLPQGEETPVFDFILSNPPYVGRQELGAELEQNVYRYEPHCALFGGEHGTELITRMLPEVPRHLRPGGGFLMEISPMIHDEVVALLHTTPGLRYLRTVSDLSRLPRIVIAQRE